MFESIRGTLKSKDSNLAIVECSGIAYRLSIPLSTYLLLPASETIVMLYLSQVIREDAHTLYAFGLKEERDLFELLLTISGIGPKTAVGIIGHMEKTVFQQAIAANDIRLLSKLPGIGKKTAERLVIEMRDKFKNQSSTTTASITPRTPGIVGDAIHALIHLGYHTVEAHRAVQAAATAHKDETDLGRLITAALSYV